MAGQIGSRYCRGGTRPGSKRHNGADIVLDIGPRLRAARKGRRLSLRALAERTGFSPSFLSQVELGQTSPSLGSLQKICAALDLQLAELLSEPERQRSTPVVRRRDRESLRSDWSQASTESLLPTDGDDHLGALLLTLDPGGRTGAIERKPGTRELAYCVRGRVVLVLGGDRHPLSAGDSAILDDAPVACWENDGKGRAEVLLVSVRAD